MELHAHSRNFSGTEVKSLKIAIAITALMTVAEVVGGILSNSIALISDAGHMFTDTLALLLSLGAIIIARRPPTNIRTYGFHRFEILAAFINGTTLVLISIYIFYESFKRFINPPEVRSVMMLVIASIGLFANLAGVYILRSAETKNLNVRGAFLHMLGDTLSSLGVIGGGFVIYLTGWRIVDPLIGVLIGGIILRSSISLILESTDILLEAVPRDISLEEVNSTITTVNGVKTVHDLHLWSITSGLNALSAHVIIHDQHISDSEKIIEEINSLLKDKFKITHTTLQLECNGCKKFTYKKVQKILTI